MPIPYISDLSLQDLQLGEFEIKLNHRKLLDSMMEVSVLSVWTGTWSNWTGNWRCVKLHDGGEVDVCWLQ